MCFYPKLMYKKKDFGPLFPRKASVEPSLAESDRQIFFIDTTCAEKRNCSVALSDRKLCGIESTARLHPNHKIFVLIVNPDNSTPDLDLVTEIFDFENVFFRGINVTEYAKNTPLEDFFATKRYAKSKFMRTHLSDILRMLTLWKFGGTYLDTDMICLKNIEVLGRNWASEENKTVHVVQSAMINFGNDKLGRFLANKCVVELNNTFDGTKWAINGPALLSRIIKRFCKTEENCEGFKILPKTTFAPQRWQDSHRYFEKKWTEAVMKSVTVAYTAHIFNHLHSKRRVVKASNVSYALLAKEFCPNMFFSPRKWF